MLTSKLEVLVDWGSDSSDVCDKTLLELRRITEVQSVEFKDGALVVESTLPTSDVLSSVEKLSGRRAVLQGFGERVSAVAEVSGGAVGVVRFHQSSAGPLVVDGTVDGLSEGSHAMRVHQAGDLSQGCESVGDVYGGAGGAGELGAVTADDSGRATFRILRDNLQIDEIIGRSLVITSSETLKNGNTEKGNSIDLSEVKSIGCGVIARSAGVFANSKRVCACDGVVVWDERDRPAAGRGRRANTVSSSKPCCGKHSAL